MLTKVTSGVVFVAGGYGIMVLAAAAAAAAVVPLGLAIWWQVRGSAGAIRPDVRGKTGIRRFRGIDFSGEFSEQERWVPGNGHFR